MCYYYYHRGPRKRIVNVHHNGRLRWIYGLLIGRHKLG